MDEEAHELQGLLDCRLKSTCVHQTKYVSDEIPFEKATGIEEQPIPRVRYKRWCFCPSERSPVILDCAYWKHNELIILKPQGRVYTIF
jgi:hypothetical protein